MILRPLLPMYVVPAGPEPPTELRCRGRVPGSAARAAARCSFARRGAARSGSSSSFCPRSCVQRGTGDSAADGRQRATLRGHARRHGAPLPAERRSRPHRLGRVANRNRGVSSHLPSPASSRPSPAVPAVPRASPRAPPAPLSVSLSASGSEKSAAVPKPNGPASSGSSDASCQNKYE